MGKDLSWKIGALLFEEGIERASHFVNQYGKRQRIPQGYFYSQAEGRLVRNPAETPFWKEDTMNKSDYYRNDYRSTQVDTSNVNVDINDRVKFVLSDSNENRGSCIEAAMKAFVMDRTDATRAFDYRRTIVCRPDQFGRFIIYRYNTVRGNQIRSLEPKLIPANDPKLYDVSRN